MKRLLLVLYGALAASPAAAQSISMNLGEGSLSGRAIQLVLLLTVLSLAPGILMTITSFTRFVVVLSLLRNGLGTQGTPPNAVLISLALFLSFFVMAPTFNQAWTNAIEPLSRGAITETVALDRAAQPFKTFMLRHTREADLALFADLAQQRTASRDELAMTTVAPAFLISELRRAFEIGFMLLLPFVVIDLVVGAILMSMGMMMMPPASVSLPVKLIFFVLVDGWNLVAGSLVQSFF